MKLLFAILINLLLINNAKANILSINSTINKNHDNITIVKDSLNNSEEVLSSEYNKQTSILQENGDKIPNLADKQSFNNKYNNITSLKLNDMPECLPGYDPFLISMKWECLIDYTEPLIVIHINFQDISNGRLNNRLVKRTHIGDLYEDANLTGRFNLRLKPEYVDKVIGVATSNDSHNINTGTVNEYPHIVGVRTMGLYGNRVGNRSFTLRVYHLVP